MTSRRQFLKASGVAALMPMIFCSQQKPINTTSPNIVLLMVDDFGWKDFKYKDHIYSMPNMKRLSREGLTFTDAYASSATCSPCRASILTGQHPARLRLVRHIPGNTEGEFHEIDRDPARMPSRNWLPLDVDTVADALGENGYHSVFLGKWHLGEEPYFPIQHGFDEQFGVTPSGHPQHYYPPYFGETSDVYQDASSDKYLTDRLTDDAVHFLESYDKNNPFFMTLFYYGVHGPYEGRKDWLEHFRNKGLQGKELQHAAMISAVDESIGRIRETLQDRGFSDNTVIVFLGDQGSAFPSDRLRGGKPGGQACYEGGCRVPFVVHWSGVVSPGRISQPVVTIDVFPTLTDLAGGNVSRYENLDGENLLPLITSDASLNRNTIVVYRSYEDQYAAIRRDQWKLIAYRSGKTELFDLENDLSETRELSAEYPDKVSELVSALYEWEQKMGVADISGYQQQGDS